jgi:hypothetical protein
MKDRRDGSAEGTTCSTLKFSEEGRERERGCEVSWREGEGGEKDRTGLLSGEQKERADTSGGGGRRTRGRKGEGWKAKGARQAPKREKERTTDRRDGSANCSNVRE